MPDILVRLYLVWDFLAIVCTLLIQLFSSSFFFLNKRMCVGRFAHCVTHCKHEGRPVLTPSRPFPPQVFLQEAERQRLHADLHREVLRLIVMLQQRFRARLERKHFVRMREAAVSIQVKCFYRLWSDLQQRLSLVLFQWLFLYFLYWNCWQSGALVQPSIVIIITLSKYNFGKNPCVSFYLFIFLSKSLLTKSDFGHYFRKVTI